MENKVSIKVSQKGKDFLKQMMLNRIKLERAPIASMSDAIELMQRYFKANNNEYIKMLKEES